MTPRDQFYPHTSPSDVRFFSFLGFNQPDPIRHDRTCGGAVLVCHAARDLFVVVEQGKGVAKLPRSVR